MGRFIMAKGFVKRGPLKMKKRSRHGGVYFLGVDTTCLMYFFYSFLKKKKKVPRVRLRSGPILTTNKPCTTRGVKDLPDMGKNYKKFMSQ